MPQVRSHRSSALMALMVFTTLSVPVARADTTCPEAAEATLRALLARNAETKVASRSELRELDCATVTGTNGDEQVAVANFVDLGHETLETREEGYTLVLATLDLSGRRVLRHSVAHTSEDATTAFHGDNLALDMGFQDIAPGGGVIGVVTTSSAIGASAPDSQWGDEFALYVPEGTGFRRVLGLARFRQEAIEGCVSVQCRGARWTETTASLSPAETDDHGWRRITLRLDAGEEAVEPAVPRSEPTTTTLTLVQRDGAYRTASGDPPPGSDYFGLVAW